MAAQSTGGAGENDLRPVQHLHRHRFSGFHSTHIIGTDCESAFRRQFARCEPLEAVRTQAKRARVIVVGIGNPLRPGALSVPGYSRMANEATSGRFMDRARELGIVGEINNRIYDDQGHDRSSDIEGLDDAFVNVLLLKDLRDAAQAISGRLVIGIADGEEKVDAIRVALDSRIVNTLITGVVTARAILAEKRLPPRGGSD